MILTAFWIEVIATIIKLLVTFAIVFTIVPGMVWAERRVCGLIQRRKGPNRVGIGPWRLMGFVQPLADVIKMAFKEEIIPEGTSKILWHVAPGIVAMTGVIISMVIPWGPDVVLPAFDLTPYLPEGVTFATEAVTIPLSVVTVDTGFLFWLAFAGLSVWGVAFAGYASNNKFSLMGGTRAIAQMISYEVPLTMSLIPVVLLYGSFNLTRIVEAQESFFMWGIFLSPVSFVIFLVCMFAETNRTPFDLPEAESELVVGYHTEYASLKFGAFMMTEYVSMTVLSCLASIFFFGGWQLPFVSFDAIAGLITPVGAHIVALGVLVLKALAFLMLYIWVRWTVPRFRYDQLMNLSWRLLVPAALANIVVTAGVLGWYKFG